MNVLGDHLPQGYDAIVLHETVANNLLDISMGH